MASRISASARPMSPPPGGLQRREVERVAEIVEQEEAVVGVGLEHARRMQAGLRDQAGDVDERAHVLLRRRRIHDDDAAAACAIGAQVAAKAGVARGRPQARRDRGRARAAMPASQAAKASVRAGSAQAMEGEAGRRDSRAASDGRSRCERASLVDNRFYKSMRRRGSRRPAARPTPATRPLHRSAPPSPGLRVASALAPCARSATVCPRRRGCAAPAGAPARRPASSCGTAPPVTAAGRRRAATPRKQLPIILQARELRGRPDLDAEAGGDVEFRRGSVVIRADRLTYDQAEDLARATGNVVVSRDGNVFFGPELQLGSSASRASSAARPIASPAPTPAARRARSSSSTTSARSRIDATYTSCSADGAAIRPGS